MTDPVRTKKILVIEDDDDIRRNLHELLESEGFATISASNGKEALDLLSKESTLPDLILLDLMMPIMDGFQFRENQKIVPRIAQIPVVVMTAASHAEEKKNRLGAVACITKPFDIDLALQTIAKALE